MEYKVTWAIDLDAASFEDVARLAREIQLDPDSLATHFIVTDYLGNDREVCSSEDNPSKQNNPKTKEKGTPCHDH